jgi:hypothetical protein
MGADMNVSFKKLRNGDWGLTGPSESLKEGFPVVVTRADGKTTRVTCGKVLWRGAGVAIAEVAKDSPAKSAPSSKSPRDLAPGGKRCPECGARDCPRAWSRYDLCQED